MAKYIYDCSHLRYGDIILVRFPGDEISERVMESTKSDYSHAMLYVDNSSYIEANKRVVARNLSRLLFDDPTDTCVLRVKEQFLKPNTINNAISYARNVVGNPYAYMDSLRLEDGRTDSFSTDTQLCTRLVAKAYATSGLYMVNNIEMCTPQQLLNSKLVNVHNTFLREANGFDIKFTQTYDVTDDMVESIFRLFDSLKPYADGKIRTMRGLIDYVKTHKDDDAAIASCLVASGYLNVVKLEEEKNKYNYDKEEFIKFYGDVAYQAAISSFLTNVNSKQRYIADYKALVHEYISTKKSLQTILLLIALQKQIIEQYEYREMICLDVMNDPRT